MKIPRRLGRPWSRWDGSYKNYTKDCNGCEWYRNIDSQEICGWGVAFKYLVKIEKPRKCEFKDKKNEDYISSAEYLDKLVLEN